MLIQGERLLLRRPLRSDETEWCALRRDSAAALLPWEPRPRPGHDPGGAAAFEAFRESAASKRHLKTLACRRDDGAIVGQFSLNEIVRGAFHSAYSGYWIASRFQGRGLATEALALLLRYGFEELGLHRIEANVQPTNGPSLRLLRRLGFRREGFSPRYLKIDGRWADHERWAICAEELSR